MPIIETQSSVKSFYEKVLKDQIDTEENLMDPVSRDFEMILKNYIDGNCYKAIDLGYGYGNYSIALAQKGFEVTSIDYVNPDIFEKRILDVDLKGKVTIHQKDLNAFKPEEMYDFIICKDVFHYLSREKAKNLIKDLVKQTNKGGWHYIVIFTDIKRKINNGTKKIIENEAQFSTEELINFINNCYYDWQVEIKVEKYQERERSGKINRFYFQSNRVTIIGNKG